ncbi:MAG: hypothetical protein JJW00_07335 [Sulfurimonas sp.]|nr:hypothetical protein [Sulfurimonas sp.]
MFDSDLLLAFGFMTILFLRQISILKYPNKINYAPLMLGVGAISSVIHFIINPDTVNVVLLLRESFLPLLVALLFYIVMNILHQTQKTQTAIFQDESSLGISTGISTQADEIKEFMLELEARMILSQKEDKKRQKEVGDNFTKDIQALETIKTNQKNFLEKFAEMDSLYRGVEKSFDDFTQVRLPELDSIFHKHIDIFRIKEQDHYNHIKDTLEKAVSSRHLISEDVYELKEDVTGIKSIADTVAKSIIKEATDELSSITKSFEQQLTTLKSHTESLETSLLESESRLDSIRNQSETIMKQMHISSKKMNDLESQNKGLHNIYETINILVEDIKTIKSDYVKSQSELNTIAKKLNSTQEQQINSLMQTLSDKIDDSLEKLHEHYHIASDDITKSVQVLAKKAQLLKGYTE